METTALARRRIRSASWSESPRGSQRRRLSRRISSRRDWFAGEVMVTTRNGRPSVVRPTSSARTRGEAGRTTEGRPFLVVTITSPANQSRLEEIRRDNLRLWDPRGLSDHEAERILRRAKAVVSMNYAIHSTEVGASLTPLVLAHRLAASPDPEVARILEETVVLLIPSHNPDGTDLVTAWQRGHAGSAFAATAPPALYQKYAGHDNNRDWYMFTQAETLLTVRHLHDRWRPQIVHDVHQMGTRGARLFLPPYLDPWEPNVDPALRAAAGALGSAVQARLVAEGKTGV